MCVCVWKNVCGNVMGVGIPKRKQDPKRASIVFAAIK